MYICTHMWSPSPHKAPVHMMRYYSALQRICNTIECIRVKSNRANQEYLHIYVIFICAYVTFYDYDHDYCKLQRIADGWWLACWWNGVDFGFVVLYSHIVPPPFHNFHNPQQTKQHCYRTNLLRKLSNWKSYDIVANICRSYLKGGKFH